MAVQIPSSPNVCCCITWETEPVQHETKKEKHQ